MRAARARVVGAATLLKPESLTRCKQFGTFRITRPYLNSNGGILVRAELLSGSFNSENSFFDLIESL